MSSGPVVRCSFLYKLSVYIYVHHKHSSNMENCALCSGPFGKSEAGGIIRFSLHTVRARKETLRELLNYLSLEQCPAVMRGTFLCMACRLKLRRNGIEGTRKRCQPSTPTGSPRTPVPKKKKMCTAPHSSQDFLSTQRTPVQKLAKSKYQCAFNSLYRKNAPRRAMWYGI